MEFVQAFVQDISDKTDLQIVTQIKIGGPFDGLGRGALVTANAIWDTDANMSSIDPRIAEMLGLEPIDRVELLTVNGRIELFVYVISLELPNGIGINTTATGAYLHGADCLIGMDVIQYGDFAISNFNGTTTLSFRIPSQGRIDFTQQSVPR